MAESDFERAVSALQRGELPQAAQGFVAVLQSEPEHVDALQLLGLCLFRLGEGAKALAALDRALALDPEHVGALCNRALVKGEQGQVQGAEADLQRALQLRPGFVAARRRLATLWVGQGRHEQAVPVLQGLLDQGHPGDRLQLAVSLTATGKASLALDLCDGLPAELANNPDVLRARGLALGQLGRLDEAVDALEAGLAAAGGAEGPRRELAMVREGLGRAMLAAGQPRLALDHLWRAHELAPGQPTVALALSDALFTGAVVPPGGEAILAGLLARPELEAQRLEGAVRAVLLRAGVGPGGGDWRVLAQWAELAVPWLSRSIVAHPAWEAWLVEQRASLFAAALAGDELPLELVEALAVQAWHTEHAWGGGVQLGALDLRRPEQVALRACWEPLRAFAPDLAREGWQERPLATLVRCSLAEPAVERAVAVPVLATSGDATSAAVRAQYEDNPYPRLVGLQVQPPRPLAERVASLCPGAQVELPAEVDILVAGCGTGRHALKVAQETAGARVLAVDLSAASLARAERLRREREVDNLELFQADILALGSLERRFHLVDSVGVLHHLAEPLAGWRVLAGLLHSGGLMRVGLYSEVGRADVRAAHQLAAERGWTPDAAGLRRARAQVRALPEDHPAAALTRSLDFYSLSGFRDLVLHACEHRFRPTQVGAMATELGLEVLGLQLPGGQARALYRERWPGELRQADLGRWEVLEAEHPWIFGGMITVWCRRG